MLPALPEGGGAEKKIAFRHGEVFNPRGPPVALRAEGASRSQTEGASSSGAVAHGEIRFKKKLSKFPKNIQFMKRVVQDRNIAPKGEGTSRIPLTNLEFIR